MATIARGAVHASIAGAAYINSTAAIIIAIHMWHNLTTRSFASAEHIPDAAYINGAGLVCIDGNTRHLGAARDTAATEHIP
jgi:hypothetical protein